MSHALEVLRYGRATRLTNGNALAARLAKSAFDAGIEIRLRHAVVDLVTQSGHVVGVVVDTPERRRTIRARRGVVLACGGFPLDIERRRDLFKHAPTGSEHFSPASPGNTGDGLRLGARAGGALQDDLPEPAAWIPVSLVRYRDGTIGHFPHLIDRYKPGIIAVTRDGKRFVNEAQSYHDVGQAMIRACRGAAETAVWLICDHAALSRYGMGFVKPFPVPHFHHVRSGYLTKASSLRELAERAGINSTALHETVARFNEKAVLGEDPEFGKGTTAYNRFLGDLGTFAGLKTDAQARVLNASGEPVPGLFAVGNDMASIMGGNYPGGGITLGPAMTFGYVVGNYLAQQHAEAILTGKPRVVPQGA
jgi:succinate dehydrogenase/fumarate reductase flavoprotein subunit